MAILEGRARTVISNVTPQIECGSFAIKRIIGECISVTADIFTDGHTEVAAALLFRHADQREWRSVPMEFLENDRWLGCFTVDTLGLYFYTLTSWIDAFGTWQRDLQKKLKAGNEVAIDLLVGIKMIEEALQFQENDELRFWLHAIKESNNEKQACLLATDPILHHFMHDCYPNKQWITHFGKELPVIVDRPKASFSAWYEIFPRSVSSQVDRHGTFKDCEAFLPEISKMGFDVLYFPPIHPIGTSKRKGRNNQPVALEGDLGSPWAIGGKEGGHHSIHPQLGTLEDFEHLIIKAKEMGIDIAIDLAFQCSPDHPYIQEHPEWFKWLPDHTIQYAENPPKKYEDIVPFNFETDKWQELWEELKNVVLYWVDKGILIFRVDNPHTKPFPFWQWLIQEVKQLHPEVIFLSEAFTRPKVMYRLAKIGFTQSYTYFTWRHTKKELIDYVTELTTTEVKEYFRPNFWPNTPDILSEELQHGVKATFMMRLLLAATLSSNYGLYGPAYELLIQEAVPGTEEYLNAEKYEQKQWQHQNPESLKALMTQINRIRRENPALQKTDNIKFYELDNDQILYFGKFSSDPFNALLIVINLDSFNSQTGTLVLPLKDLGLTHKGSFRVHELLSDRHFIWGQENQIVNLDPNQMPAAIFKISKKIRREADFEYFM
jgi:starch synthase (maltosyl-transferring)